MLMALARQMRRGCLRFAAEGGQAIITADANMLKPPHQLLAVQASNVVGLVLPYTWAEAKRHVQASSLIYHWPEIEAAFSSAQAGEFWRMPVALHRASIEKLVINYASADRSQGPPA
jgi:hypothetical protein